MLDATKGGEITIRLPIDGCGLSHETHATSFVALYKDQLGIVRIDMNDPDDDLLRLLDRDAVLSGYIPIEP